MPKEYTEEERLRRSELAKSLHEKGVFGGAQPGAGRPPVKKRAMALVAEEAEKNAKQIVEAFKAGIDPSQPATVRVNSAREWLQVERHETELQIKEGAQLDEMSAKDLYDLIRAKMGRLAASGQTFDHEGNAEEEVLELPEAEDIG